MAFPQTLLPLKSELYVDSLGWVDITSDIRHDRGITITRGRERENNEVRSGTCDLVLNNRHGKYSPRNPLSAYYGLIGRNTPVRFKVGLITDTFTRSVAGGLGTTDTGQTWTLDNAANWSVSSNKAVFQYEAAGDTENATLNNSECVDSEHVVDISVSAVATGVGAASLSTGTVARYVDSSNFYWFRVDFDPSGQVTAILGKRVAAVSTNVDFATVPGLTYAANTVVRVRSSCVGNRLSIKVWLASDPEPRDWTVSAIDSDLSEAGRSGFRLWRQTGNTNSPVSATYDSFSVSIPRFYGEISSWPSRWDISGNDQWVPVEASGILRRLRQGQKALKSPIYRTLSRHNPTAYWPLEDGSDSTYPSSGISGGTSGVAEDVSFGNDDTPPGAKTCARLNSTSSRLSLTTEQQNGLTEWSFVFYFKLDSLPASNTTLLNITSTGTVVNWAFNISATGYEWVLTNSSGTNVVFQGTNFGVGAEPTNWIAMNAEITQNGGNVDLVFHWHAVGSNTFYTDGTKTYAGTIGSITRFKFGRTGVAPASIAHVGAFPEIIPFVNYTEFAATSNGYIGETAGNRLIRLGAEEGVTVAVVGDPDDTAAMGSQTAKTFLDLITECAHADGGILQERRDNLALDYRTRMTLYNQTPLTISYADGHLSPPFEPVEDDAYVRNDITVSRDRGSSARAVQETGPLSVEAPPNGVGVYDESVSLNLYDDSQLLDQATWRRHLGTVDEARYPRVRINLASSAWSADQLLTRNAVSLDSGHTVSIDELPTFLPPGPVTLMIQGYTERLNSDAWDITWNATPGSAWNVAEPDADYRLDSDSSVLSNSVTSSATSLFVFSDDLDRWTTNASDLPVNVLVGGEEMSVTAVETAIFDAFSRSVSNGWGGPTSWQSYSVIEGAASQFDVNGIQGRMTHSAANASAVASLDTLTFADIDITIATLTISAAPTGGNAEVGMRARVSVAGNSYVDVRIFRVAAGGATIAVRQVVSGVESNLSSFVAIPNAANNSNLSLRFQVEGTTVRAKAWVITDPEPVAWTVSTTVNYLDAGFVRYRAATGSGMTSLPITFTFDGISGIRHQRFAVTRSMNGVVKAHDAGTEVHVANPAIVPL